ncbi:MAG: hypothetical protein JXQ83_06005 [Candidatus Glassbacteria bacterium]|nr:hypothetical protein [Candidatus Glassbacteria bacterium]
MNRFLTSEKNTFIAVLVLAAAVFSLSCNSRDKSNWQVVDPETGIKTFTIKVVSGNYQNGVIGQTLPDSLVAYVADENNYPEPAYPVEWWVNKGEGTMSPVRSITDVNGFTATTFTPSGLPGDMEVVGSPFSSKASVVFYVTVTGQ